MKDKKDKKEKIEKKAVDPEEKIKEDKPEIIVAPRCIMEIVENKETGGIDIVYSKNCSGGKIREVAGIIAVDGVRFRPEPEEKPEKKPEETFFLKSDREKSKEKIKKEFEEKVKACEESESCKTPESES